MFQDFQERLQDGETILWAGRPDALRYASAKLLYHALVFPAAWALILAYLQHHFHFHFSLESNLVVSILVFVVWMAIVHGVAKDDAVRIRYALTNRRILIRQPARDWAQSKPFEFDSLALETLHPRLQERADGFGAVAFGSYWFAWDRAFRAIADAPHVFHLVQTAQAQTTPSAFPYYVSQPKASPTEAGDTEFWRDERVLWSGKPNPRAFVRRFFWPQTLGRAFCVTLLALGLCFLAFSSVTASQALTLTLVSTVATALGTRLLLQAEAAGLRYTITNKRLLLVSQGGKPWRDEREIWLLGRPQRKRETNGTETWVFDQTINFDRHGPAVRKFAFVCVDESERIQAALAEAEAEAEKARAMSYREISGVVDTEE